MKPVFEMKDNLIHMIKWNSNLQLENAYLALSKHCII